MLGRLGYSAICTSDCAQAKALIRMYGDTVRLALIDHEVDPATCNLLPLHIPVVMMSGGPDLALLAHGKRPSMHRLPKPFRLAQIDALLRRLLAAG